MAGRPRKIVEEEEKTSEVQSNDNLNVQDLLTVIKNLQDEVNKIKNSNSNSNLVENKKEDEEDEEINSIRISPDTYIKVISLVPYNLNISTEPKGRGKIFKFSKFGMVKQILYSDLILIIENYSHFLEKGYFTILNQKVIKKHGLEEYYGKVLSKEMIEEILLGNQSDAVNLFKNANKDQQQTISEMFVNKLIENESVDLNFLDRISRIMGYSIQEKANSMKRSLEINKKN